MTSDSNSLSHSDESQGTNRFEGHGPATGYCVLPGEVGLRLFLRQVLLLTLSVITIAGCSGDATGQKKGNDAMQRPVVPVTVTTSVEKAVPVQLRAIGKVQAFSTVTIKSQVAGQIVSVHFREGQEVKQGDLLFTIDPRPFEANVKKAEAQLAKDRAQLQNAKKLIERYQAVVKRGYVSEEQYDTALANLAALESTVRAGEAAVESARLELKYCTIHSPIGGYTGEVKVHQGNIMKENDNDRPMVTINQVSPIHVSFSVPEQHLPEINRHLASGELGVLARVQGDEGNPVSGQLSFIDNAVNSDTGTIQLKATFTNEARTLWPGQFANVVLTLTTQAGAVVVPSQAVQTGQQGQYVFVVKPDSTVEYRPVVGGRTIDHEAVIDKGLSGGERVVTDGQLRLAQGSPIKVLGNAQESGGMKQ